MTISGSSAELGRAADICKNNPGSGPELRGGRPRGGAPENGNPHDVVFILYDLRTETERLLNRLRATTEYVDTVARVNIRQEEEVKKAFEITTAELPLQSPTGRVARYAVNDQLEALHQGSLADIVLSRTMREGIQPLEVAFNKMNEMVDALRRSLVAADNTDDASRKASDSITEAIKFLE
jgi:hypothetical protein